MAKQKPEEEVALEPSNAATSETIPCDKCGGSGLLSSDGTAIVDVTPVIENDEFVCALNAARDSKVDHSKSREDNAEKVKKREESLKDAEGYLVKVSQQYGPSSPQSDAVRARINNVRYVK